MNAERAPHGKDQAAKRSDRRHDPRRRVLKKALIIFDAGRCSMACHVIDVSETGAMVMPSDVFLCPDEFVLKPLVGPTRECEVVWRRGLRIGIRYM